MPRPRLLRPTIGALMVLVALVALGVAWLRPQHTRVVDIREGTGAAVKVGDTVVVHYVGTLADGEEFDNSRARGTPVDFPIGRGTVIKGWDAGMIGMRVGGLRRLVIPFEEGYGEKGMPPVIPPKSKLIFEVELLAIK